MEPLTEQALSSLRDRGFLTHTFDSPEAMADFLVSAVPDGKSVGFGGSMTLYRDLSLYDRLKARELDVWYHNAPNTLPREEVLRRAHTADIYMLSANAVSADGGILNIDGNGNRVAAVCFGPRVVYLAVSESKICPDRAAALARAKSVACVENARRLNRHTPCAAVGACADCRSPERICSFTVWTDWVPRGREFHVCVCPGTLGF